MLSLMLKAVWQSEELTSSHLDFRIPPGANEALQTFGFLVYQCHLLKDECLGQVLVPLCGLLLRALYVETGVHRGCLHGGGFLRRPGGDGLYP